MNSFRSRFKILLLLFFYSCTSHHREKESAAPVVAPVETKVELKAGTVITSVSTQQDPSQTYALYLPSNYSDSVKYPVIIFFDPHGSGSYPVSIYHSLAEHFRYILMGSNISKNGMQFDQTNAIVNALMNEAITRFSTDRKRISLAGFSGGAKVALVAGAEHPELISVIYCGAAVPLDKVTQYPPALGFAGERDMNYTEVMSSGSALTEKKISHAIINWKGIHEWPDSSSFQDAFYWSSFNAMKNKSMLMNNNLIKDYIQDKNKILASSRNVLEQYNVYSQIISFLKDLTDVSLYEMKISLMAKSEAFQKEIQKQQDILKTETNLKQNYLQCFESKDGTWWSNEIKRMRGIQTGDQEKMYKRLIGYLSLASYSYSNNAVKQNDFASAKKYLAIYKLSDPENSEQPFLTACMYAREGDQQNAIASLQDAIKLGLKDRMKIENEESFNTLRSNPEFNQLLSQL
jgi:predicted esterase